MKSTFITLLLTLARVHCMADGQLFIDSSCRLSYQIKDLYNVTVQDLGSVCPQNSIMPPTSELLHNSDKYRLNIKPTHTGRKVEIDWEHSSCYQEYYIQFEANFQPDWRLDNTRRKCIRVVVVYLPNKWEKDIDSRLHFNCLQINSRKMGTLAIQNSRHNIDMNCHKKGSSDSLKYDLGCGFDKSSVDIDNCMRAEFHGLHSHTDFKKTKIVYEGIGNCSRTYDGTHIYRLSDNPLQGHLNMPVYGNGTHSVYIMLVCNASGEVANRTFSFLKTVTKASSCSTYNSSVLSTCAVSETASQSKEAVTVRSTLAQNQLYTVISVVLVLCTVAIIVTVVFISQHRRRTHRHQQEGITEAGQRNTELHPMQTLCGDGVNGAAKNKLRGAGETTILYTRKKPKMSWKIRYEFV